MSVSRLLTQHSNLRRHYFKFDAKIKTVKRSPEMSHIVNYNRNQMLLLFNFVFSDGTIHNENHYLQFYVKLL